MAKRFTDTDKYKKKFFRNLPGPYKLFWDYLYHDCDHAGIWHVDFEIAQIYLGKDMQVDFKEAVKLFNEDEIRVVLIDDDSKWFIKSFIDFQYGNLNPDNRVHSSILAIIEKYKIKGLARTLKGSMDKDKDKDMDKDKELYEISFNEFWENYPKRNGKKIGKKITKVKFFKLKNSDLSDIIAATKNYSESKQVMDGFAKDPERFFKNDYWKDWLDPENAEKDYWKEFDKNAK